MLPFIFGTLGVMVVAAIISTPLSVGLALFMSEIAPNWARRIAQPAMEVFVGIPSVVYGWLGITILVPYLRDNFASIGFTLGFSWFAGSVVLSLMILPTITSVVVRRLPHGPGRDAHRARWPSARPAGRRSATCSCRRRRRAS